MLQLAAERPVDEITAVQLAATAGVTRRTLYNHTSSPQQLLVDLLRAEIQAIGDAFEARQGTGMPLGKAWRRGDDELAEHILRYAAIYGAGITDPQHHLSPSLSHMLSDVFEAGAIQILSQRDDVTSEDALLTGRFIGHGIVGAIEAWLLTPKLDPRQLSRGIWRSIPSWVSGIE